MKIEIKSNNYLPVEIGYLKFSVSLDDENLETIVKNYQEVDKEIKKSSHLSLSESKTVFLKAFDALLGEGAGNKIYEQTPSMYQCVEILTQLLVQLKEELQAIYNPSEQTSAINEYLSK